ncbi:hypothetical protein GC194_11010 [bacterium]|nr:hypothetical protein [bacterium]
MTTKLIIALVLAMNFTGLVLKAQTQKIPDVLAGTGKQRGRLAKGVGLSVLQSGEVMLASVTVNGMQFNAGSYQSNNYKQRVWLGIYDEKMNLKYKTKVPDISVYFMENPEKSLQQIVLDSNDLVHIFYTKTTKSEAGILKFCELTFNTQTHSFSKEREIWSGNMNKLYDGKSIIKFSVRRLVNNRYKVWMLRYMGFQPEVGGFELSATDLYAPLPESYGPIGMLFMKSDFTLDKAYAVEKTPYDITLRSEFLGVKCQKHADPTHNALEVVDCRSGKKIYTRAKLKPIEQAIIVNNKNDDFYSLITFSGNLNKIELNQYRFSKSAMQLVDSTHCTYLHTDSTGALPGPDSEKRAIYRKWSEVNFKCDVNNSNLLVSSQLVLHDYSDPRMVTWGDGTSNMGFSYFEYYYDNIDFMVFAGDGKINTAKYVDAKQVIFEYFMAQGGYIQFLNNDGSATLMVTYKKKRKAFCHDYMVGGLERSNYWLYQKVYKIGKPLTQPVVSLHANDKIIVVKNGRRMKPIRVALKE